MDNILDLLRIEHMNTAKLLRAFERQIGIFENGGQPDYELMEGVIDYLTQFPDKIHHPKEDLIYHRLKEKDPSNVGFDLAEEHDDLAALTKSVGTALQDVLQDTLGPRDWIISVARNFIGNYRRHMRLEENIFFPQAEKSLDESDWADLNKQMVEYEEDPLFDKDSKEHFARLYDYIQTMDAEDMKA